MAIKIGFRSVDKIIAEKMKVRKVYVGDMTVYDRTVDPNVILPLNFVAEQAGSTVALNKVGSPAWEGEYSLDNENWLPYVPSTTGTITLVNAGDKVYFRGNITANFSASNYLQFSMIGRLWAAGNVNSMYVAEDFEELKTLTYSYCYRSMFYGCTALTTAPILPATTIRDYCYASMFSGCTALTTAPELPATTLGTQCYASMFSGCTALTTAPELPATTIRDYCYHSMFRGCTSLNTVPELPATTARTNCYNSMFRGCTSLTTAPELPATTLGNDCYYDMFRGCTALTTAPILPATTLRTNCYRGMFYGCTALITVPELPATTLANYCYNSMFNGCTLIKVSLTKEGIYQNTWQFGTTLTAISAGYMFYDTGGTFTGTPEVAVLYTSNTLI